MKEQDRRHIICMTELDAISLGLKLLDELEILHNMKVIHSAINPSSVYLRGGDIAHPAFLDLELAIWDPKTILEYESEYFK